MCHLDANLYFYEFINEVVLVAKNVDGGTNPEDFPFPCQSGKCARGTVYICRRKKVECCDFCKFWKVFESHSSPLWAISGSKFVETPITSNFEQVVKRLFTVIWTVTIALANCRISFL